MKIALLNDSHIGARNASPIFLDYFARFYQEIFFPYCDANGIRQIVHLGDFYDHRKFINFTALYHNRKTFLEPMRDLGMVMDIIPGNHDVVYKNTNEISSLKELLGFFINNVNIVMQPKVLSYDGCNIAMLPWINPENLEDSMKFIKGCNSSILCAHLELVGFDMMAGMPNQHGMDPKEFERFEMVLTGHYHTKSTRGNINYLGTQYEMTWADCYDRKFFHVLDTDTRTIEAIHNPITIFQKYFYDDTAEDPDTVDVSKFDNHFVKVLISKKTDLFKFDRFMDRLQKRPVHDIKIVENFDQFLGSNPLQNDVESMEDTTQLLSSYVDVLQTDLNKDTIKTKLRELYTEASSLETE
jgi:hypothetical protein